jgi:hypothetical protein
MICKYIHTRQSRGPRTLGRSPQYLVDRLRWVRLLSTVPASITSTGSAWVARTRRWHARDVA